MATLRIKDMEADIQKQNEAEKIKKSKAYKLVRKNLIEQLEKTGANTPVFENLVDSYMGFYLTMRLCEIDITNRGVFVEYNNGGGQSGITDNPSLDKMAKANTQMLKILSYLKISVQLTVVGETDDEL